MSQSVLLRNVTLGFPHLWQPHAPVPGAAAKYSAEFSFDPNDPNHVAMHAAMMAEIAEQGKTQFAGQIHPPWDTGEEINERRAQKAKDPRQELVGKLVVNAKDPSIAPLVVAQDGRTRITEEQSANLFGGCVVNADIDVYWSKNAQNPGLFCGLRGVQLVDNVNVQRLGGVARDVKFAPVEGAPSTLNAESGAAGPAPVADPTDSWM